MGVYRYLSSARLAFLPRLALPQPLPRALPRVPRPLASRACSTGVIRSPFEDVIIPELSITNYTFEAQEQYADKPALVSTGRCEL